MSATRLPPTAGRRLETSARTLIVGDIHACFDEFQALIALAGLSESDRIVAVGDLVDRGPQPWEVVDFFRARPETRFAVCGNHEWKHLLHAANPVMPSRAGMVTRGLIGPERYALALDYFERLPLWIELPEALVVHAGVDPAAPLATSDPKLIMGVASNTRPGFDGESPWWFDDPRLDLAKPVVFGHHVFPEVARGRRANVWGINTGAGYGGTLSGLLLPEFRLVSVPSADYVSAAPGRWESEAELQQIALLPWRRLFKLLERPEALPEPALAIAAAARETFDAVVARITAEGRTLRAAYRVDELSHEARSALFTSLRKSPRFADRYGQCVYQALKGHQVAEAFAKFFPTLRDVREAAAAGRLESAS